MPWPRRPARSPRPSARPRAWRINTRVLLAVLLLAVAAVALPEIGRAGYSTDEEFTVFAARGIAAGGLPLLPSDLLYDRGLAYSYASWLAGSVFDQTLPVYRAVALGTALAALLALASLVRTFASGTPAIVSVLLVSVSLPFWAVATTARFYAPFLLFYLLALTELAKLRAAPFRTCPAPIPHPFRTLISLSALSFVARLTHELALSLVVIPGAILLLRVVRDRVKGLDAVRPWIAATIAIAVGLGFAQAVMFAMHYLAPASGETMIRRFFLWQLFNLFGSPSEALDFVAHIARTWPLLTTSVIGLMAMRAIGLGGTWTGPERFVHLLWIGWAVFFGIIDSGITINYLLVPVTLMLVAMAIDLAAVTASRFLPIAALAAMAVVAVEQWGSPVQARARLEAARPTIAMPPGLDLRTLAARAERVACTDELACLMLAGRVDTWLALDDFLRQRFVVARNGREEGVYAGAPVARTLADAFVPDAEGGVPATVLVIDVFKDLPVGPSAAFLDRALASESVTDRTLLTTLRFRVVDVSRVTDQPSEDRK